MTDPSLFEEEEIKGSVLEELAKYHEEYKVLSKNIKDLEDRLFSNRAALETLRTTTIPEYMANFQIDGIVMEDGSTMGIKDFVYARLGEDRKACIQWLDDNGHSSITKNEIKIPLKKGSHNIAQAIIATLKEQWDITAEVESTVHWKTLESWAKEMMQQGKTLPELFEFNHGRRATFK